MAREHGVLPYQTLKRSLDIGLFKGVGEKYVNPASIDLPLSREIYRLENVFLPQRGETIRSLLPLSGAVEHDFRNPIEVGVPYLAFIGAAKLLSSMYGYFNPKSSSGRLNLFCRAVADGVDMYDALTPAGYCGEVWMLIEARSFPILLSPGQAISQVRFFDGPAFLDPLELELVHEETGLLFGEDGKPLLWRDVRRHADSLFLSLAVPEGMAGWECRGVNRVLDFDKLRHYRPQDFFEPVEGVGGKMKLRKGNLYILSTAERVMVPPLCSAELRATDPRLGEFRSHTAGYIDPGWGFGKNGEWGGRQITLEMIPNQDLQVRHRQSVVRIRYEHMKERPEKIYDEVASNYTKQVGPTLSKHFKKD